MKNYDLCLENNFKALEYFQQIDDSKGIGRIYNNIGLTYNDLEDYQQALSYHQKALEIRTKSGNKEGMAISYNSLGNVYKKMKNSGCCTGLLFAITFSQKRDF